MCRAGLPPALCSQRRVLDSVRCPERGVPVGRCHPGLEKRPDLFLPVPDLYRLFAFAYNSPGKIPIDSLAFYIQRVLSFIGLRDTGVGALYRDLIEEPPVFHDGVLLGRLTFPLLFELLGLWRVEPDAVHPVEFGIGLQTVFVAGTKARLFLVFCAPFEGLSFKRDDALAGVASGAGAEASQCYRRQYGYHER